MFENQGVVLCAYFCSKYLDHVLECRLIFVFFFCYESKNTLWFPAVLCIDRINWNHFASF
jgi:hypothetical protein